MNIWNITENDSSLIAKSNDLEFNVGKKNSGNISFIDWKDNFKHLKMLHADSGLRTGITYDLFSYNLLTEPARPILQNSSINKTEGTLISRYELRDIELIKKIIPEEDGKGFQMEMSMTKTGAGQDKWQMIFGAAFEVLNENNLCFAAQGINGKNYFRPGEPSKQEINDQDGFVSFPKFLRLSGNSFKAISPADAKSIIFSGDGIKYFNCNRNSKIFYVNAYGFDLWLEKGQSHTELFSVKLGDMREAILDKKYISEEKAKVFFNGNGTASIEKDGKVLTRNKAEGTVELDVSDLKDGKYNVVMDNGSGSNTEELIIIRNEYKELENKIKTIQEYSEKLSGNDAPLVQLRQKGLEFKLWNAREYMKYCELDQVAGLLKDADRITKAIESDEDAIIPQMNEVIYENDFSEANDDFEYFGNGNVTFPKDKGLFLDPVITINMWSRFKLEGSFCIEFDYMPLQGTTGGTMVQLCGNHFNPVNDAALMCSASGQMPHYNFGQTCYHFSFCRGENYNSIKTNPKPRVCNFRKTGKGFYVLNQIADPVPDSNNEWFRLRFAKNERQFMFFVNDKLVQEYFDEGNQGAFLNGGNFGIRNWSRRKAYYKNLRIYK
jgi:hypothetical protein